MAPSARVQRQFNDIEKNLISLANMMGVGVSNRPASHDPFGDEDGDGIKNYLDDVDFDSDPKKRVQYKTHPVGTGSLTGLGGLAGLGALGSLNTAQLTDSIKVLILLQLLDTLQIGGSVGGKPLTPITATKAGSFPNLLKYYDKLYDAYNIYVPGYLSGHSTTYPVPLSYTSPFSTQAYDDVKKNYQDLYKLYQRNIGPPPATHCPDPSTLP